LKAFTIFELFDATFLDFVEVFWVFRDFCVDYGLFLCIVKANNVWSTVGRGGDDVRVRLKFPASAPQFPAPV